VKVFEETRALSVKFVDNNYKGRPVTVKWETLLTDASREPFHLTIWVDATGRDGIMAQKVSQAPEG